MAINNDLIKAILKQLYDLAPKEINGSDDDARDKILPEYEDREEIKDHLDYLEDRGYIKFEKWETSRDYPEGKLKHIKITDEGEIYFLAL